MKTLDEVIFEVPYSPTPWEADALHYLRQLQLFRQTPLMHGIHKAQKEYSLYPVEDWGEENLPLTWKDLQQMEGKPVWVEGKTVKHWAVITGIYYDDLNEGYLLETYYAEKQGSNTSRRKRSTLGKTWQAYRKER